MGRLDRLTEQGFIDLVASLAGAARPARGARFRPVLGIGDDAAILPAGGRLQTLFTTDCLAEGVHFRRAWSPGFLLGRKALAVNLSDIAAMGGVPRACVISAGFPARTRPAYAREVARGLADRARRHGVALVGGDTARARSLFLNVALLGAVEPGRAVRRSGARAGDGLYVTGALGASAAGLGLLRRGVRAGKGKRGRRAGQALRAHLDPEPRVTAGRLLGLTGLAAAMIDLSDGLWLDLPRLCDASGTGAVVEEAAVPLSAAAAAVLGPSGARRAAIVGGEDYELLFAARAGLEAQVAHLARRIRLPMSRIGEIVPRRRGVRLLTRSGRYVPFAAIAGGFRHFPADA
ncbi:MAG TPA: thiamine-phosphate kinase [Candidatus Polarisedimenticolia bacterium]|jgi:thiamine-monophosphate kinase|nr:thiamine-phosphate kinase [Candidatus Polarisedimenticolia bacterium]